MKTSYIILIVITVLVVCAGITLGIGFGLGYFKTGQSDKLRKQQNIKKQNYMSHEEVPSDLTDLRESINWGKNIDCDKFDSDENLVMYYMCRPFRGDGSVLIQHCKPNPKPGGEDVCGNIIDCNSGTVLCEDKINRDGSDPLPKPYFIIKDGRGSCTLYELTNSLKNENNTESTYVYKQKNFFANANPSESCPTFTDDGMWWGNHLGTKPKDLDRRPADVYEINQKYV